jgi:O-antigen ligase
MIFEGEFFSGGHLRWNLGWPTPNYAGAFVATMVVLLWSLTTSRWRGMGLIAEAAGLFLLAKTYSRGAVAAWTLAWGFGVLASRGWENASQRRIWLARVGLLVTMLLVTGFGWSRAAPRLAGAPASDLSMPKTLAENKSDGASEDGSVTNRLALWRGGLQMIAAAPLTGWGAGESGRAYMNWYQDIGRTEGYSTMVNSYLHIGVEQGLPVLGAVLGVLAWLLTTVWRRRRSARYGVQVEDRRNFSSSVLQSLSLSVAAGAAIVAWAVANVFTTLWIEPKLWIVPVMAASTIAIGTAKDRGRMWWPALGWGALSGLLGVFLLWLGGIYLGRGSPLRIEPIGGGAVLVTKKRGDQPARFGICGPILMF